MPLIEIGVCLALVGPWALAIVVVIKSGPILTSFLDWYKIHRIVGGEPASFLDKRLKIEEERTKIASMETAANIREREALMARELQYAEQLAPPREEEGPPRMPRTRIAAPVPMDDDEAPL